MRWLLVSVVFGIGGDLAFCAGLRLRGLLRGLSLRLLALRADGHGIFRHRGIYRKSCGLRRGRIVGHRNGILRVGYATD